MSRGLLKHATKEKEDFQRVLSLFNLQKELGSLFSAWLMKAGSVLRARLRSYPLQGQPRLSSGNKDPELHGPPGPRQSPVLSRGESIRLSWGSYILGTVR